MLCCLLSIWALSDITLKGSPGFKSEPLAYWWTEKGGRGNEYDGGVTQNAFHPENDFGRRGTRNGTNSDI